MIDTIYKTLLTIINKENQGYVSPAEFNLIGNNVEQEIFREYFEDANRDRAKENRGLTSVGYGNLSLNQRQKIQQFAAIANIDVSDINGVPVFQLPEDLYFVEDQGIVSLGSDSNVTGRVIDEVERSQINYMKITEAAPTVLYPVYERYNTYMVVEPSTINRIELRYLRTPKAPNWTYQVVGGKELFNPSSSSFQDFELHESEFSNIIVRMLSFFGINLREEQVIAVAEGMKQQEQLKTNS